MRDHVGDQTAGARLGGGQGRPGAHELGDEGLGDVGRAFAHDQGAEPLVDQPGRRLDQVRASSSVAAEALMRKLIVAS